uniref:C-type lectin domain family 4 member C n=1 Tax=Chlorocebus sabaeus TaxID=60711 RepID=A0A0D9RBQ7_CHLSB
MVPEEEPQDREKGVWWFQLKVWSVAVVSILLLCVCFTVNSVMPSCCVLTRWKKSLSWERNYYSFYDAVIVLLWGFNLHEDWSCCPTPWTSFQSSCYFISTMMQSWTNSQNNCSVMGADLVVINTKEEQVCSNRQRQSLFLSPQSGVQWRNLNSLPPLSSGFKFWHSGEPNNPDERCAVINFRSEEWGWNDVHCHVPQKSICKMKKIYI